MKPHELTKKSMVTLLLFYLFACVADDVEPETTPLNYIDRGWSHFEAAEYPEALQDFSSAKVGAEMMLDTPTTLLAIAGAGWTQIMQNNLSGASDSFYLSFVHPNTDILAGDAFVAHAEGAHFYSNLKINGVLAHDPSWAFAHLPNVDVNNLYLLKAHNHFSQNQFQLALDAFKMVDPAFDANIESQLGQQALLDAIEALNPGIAGFTN